MSPKKKSRLSLSKKDACKTQTIADMFKKHKKKSTTPCSDSTDVIVIDDDDDCVSPHNGNIEIKSKKDISSNSKSPLRIEESRTASSSLKNNDNRRDITETLCKNEEQIKPNCPSSPEKSSLKSRKRCFDTALNNSDSAPMFKHQKQETNIKHSMTEKQYQYDDANNNNTDTEHKGNNDNLEEETSRKKYYLDNFETILTSVLEDDTNSILFNNKDNEILDAYKNLPETSKMLYIRLFSRKMSWIPLSRIKYSEIAEDLSTSLKDLADANFIDSDDKLTDLGEVLNALSGPDIKALAKTYHVAPSMTQKSQLVTELLHKSQQSSISSMFSSKKLDNIGTGAVADAMLKKAKTYISGIYRLVKDVRAVFVRAMTLFSLLDTHGDDNNDGGGQGQLFQMLMVNMGTFIYPTYTVRKVNRVFQGREDLIRFEESLQLESDLLQCTHRGKWSEAHKVHQRVMEVWHTLEKDKDITSWNKKLPDFLRSFTATSVIYRLLNTGVDILQRHKEYAEAVILLRGLLAQGLYCTSHRGYWWERLALNLDAHLKSPQEALDAISAGLDDPHVQVGHRLALYQRGETICKKPKLKLSDRLKELHHDDVIELPKTYIEGRVVHQGITTSLTMGPRFLLEGSGGQGEDDMCVGNVEEFVLDYYKDKGFPQGIHAEGGLVGCLFALYFWDILFMDVTDAFHGPWQSQPLDLHSDNFYQNRHTHIDERLTKLADSSVEELQSMAETTWNEYEGVSCIGMNWEKWKNIEFVKGLVGCMGGKVVSGITGRYARCPRHTRSGFPDLTLWNVETGAFKISEVKSPTDHLSNKQILWIDFLVKQGVDAEVCHVKAVSGKKLKAS